MRFTNVVFSLLFLFMSVTLAAQEVTVTGQVLDSVSGDGVPFAGVFVKGTTTGVATDYEGRFSIAVGHGGAELLISSIGYVE